jgi:tetratricopeptide (TPR) repeat protein
MIIRHLRSHQSKPFQRENILLTSVLGICCCLMTATIMVAAAARAADRTREREAIRSRRSAMETRRPSTQAPKENLFLKLQQLTQEINSGALGGDELRQKLDDRAFIYATTGRSGLANQDLKKVFSMNPQDQRAFYIQGLAHLGVDPRSAIGPFSQVIRIQPQSIDAYRGRAWANLLTGSYSDAVNDFSKVLAIDPNDCEAYRGRGWGQLQAKRYDRAMADFRELHRCSPANPEAKLGEGLANYFSGHLEAARQDFRSVMRYSPAPSRPLTINDLRFDDWQRFKRVISLLGKQTQRHPNDLDAWLAMGVVGYCQLDEPGLQMNMESKAVARSAFDRAISIKPDDIDVLMVHSAYYSTPWVAFNLNTAIGDLTEVIRLKPDYAEAYFRRALLRAIDKEQLPSAMEDCEKAIALSKKSPRLNAVLEKLKADQRAWDQAKQQAAALKQEHKRQTEVAAAAFLTGFAVLLANYNPPEYAPNPDPLEQALDDYTRAMFESVGDN